MAKKDLIVDRLTQATPHELRAFAAALKVSEKKLTGEHVADAWMLAREYRSCAGNSIANIGRGPDDLSYKQVLVDVADKVKDGWTWTDFERDDSHSERQIEDWLLKQAQRHLTEKMAELDPDKRDEARRQIENEFNRLGYPANYAAAGAAVAVTTTAGALTAGPLAAALWYGGVFGFLRMSLFGIAGELLLAGGAVAAAASTAVFGVLWAASPAYSKTTPATFLLIAIRERLRLEASLNEKN